MLNVDQRRLRAFGREREREIGESGGSFLRPEDCGPPKAVL
jgi:hypothetical protein